MMDIKILQALLFLKGQEGIKISELSAILKKSKKEINNNLNKLEDYFIKTDSPFILKKFEDFYWLSINQEIGLALTKILKKDVSIKLSKSLIETLTIIAYNQPATKSDVEKIRGFGAEYAFAKLIDYNLIEDLGIDKTRRGKPHIYQTTSYFLKLFNLKSLAELPILKKDFLEKTEELNLFDYQNEKDLQLNYDENIKLKSSAKMLAKIELEKLSEKEIENNLEKTIEINQNEL
ncbi:MAG: segregation and condensation protein B [Candidatus Hepatoplasma scabrum]|nr:MAG: segregation and condensation protein B [Candidatus Hepatoplasma sp.]